MNWRRAKCEKWRNCAILGTFCGGSFRVSEPFSRTLVVQIVVKFCRTDSSRRNGEVTAIHLQRGCCPCYQPSRESRHSLSAKGVMAFLLGGEQSPYSAESSVGKPVLVQGIIGLPDVFSPLDGKQDQGVPGYPRVQLAVTCNLQDPLGFLLVEGASRT